MPVKFFLDTNIIIYAIGNDANKKKCAERLLDQAPILSTQVLTECANVCLHKFKLPPATTQQLILHLSNNAKIIEVTQAMIAKALELQHQYQFRFYDSLILASAKFAECSVVFSEDLHHQQIIEGLQIINPFLTEKS